MNERESVYYYHVSRSFVVKITINRSIDRLKKGGKCFFKRILSFF